MSPKEVTQAVIASATPVRLIAKLRMNAAVMISRIMPVVLAVCTKQCCSSSHVSFRLFQANSSEAITPSAADSVVVAKPLYRLPITMKNTTPGGTRSFNRCIRVARGTFSSRTALPVYKACNRMKPMNAPASSRPGMMPATNSLLIEVSVNEP
ncbi:hypothetical protein D9M68_723790 [compost metagenome]